MRAWPERQYLREGAKTATDDHVCMSRETMAAMSVPLSLLARIHGNYRRASRYY